MYYGSQEDKDRAIETKIRERREAAALFPEVRKVIEQFDGKVYNVRFDKALRAAVGKVYTEQRGGRIYIYTLGTGSNWHHIASLSREDMKDGKRINAAAFIESARRCREILLKEAYQIERAAEDAPKVKMQIEEIRKTLEAVIKNIPYEVRDIYDLNYHIRNY